MKQTCGPDLSEVRGHLTCHPSCGLRGEAGLIMPEEETEEEGVWSGGEGAGSEGGGGGEMGLETEI